MDLKFATKDWHNDHQADEAYERHDDVEEGIVSLVEPVEDEKHVEVNEAVHLKGEEVQAVAEELEKN